MCYVTYSLNYQEDVFPDVGRKDGWIPHREVVEISVLRLATGTATQSRRCQWSEPSLLSGAEGEAREVEVGARQATHRRERPTHIEVILIDEQVPRTEETTVHVGRPVGVDGPV